MSEENFFSKNLDGLTEFFAFIRNVSTLGAASLAGGAAYVNAGSILPFLGVSNASCWRCAWNIASMFLLVWPCVLMIVCWFYFRTALEKTALDEKKLVRNPNLLLAMAAATGFPFFFFLAMAVAK